MCRQQQKTARILIAATMLACSIPVWADESAQMPPLPPRETSPVAAPATQRAETAPNVAVPSASPAVPAAASSTPADPNALLYADTVAPGPFEAKRKILLASIKAAKKQGFGITVYLGELNKIEQQVKEGQAGPQLEQRIDSIADGLQDQLKRSQILKTQRPGPPVHMQASAGGGSSGGGGGVGLGGLGVGPGNSDMLQKLRAKYGDKVPANIDPSMLNSDMAKEFLKKFKGGN